MAYYPSWIYTAREDITQANMKTYDQMKDKIWNRCCEINPDFPKLSLRERIKIQNKVEDEIGYHL